MIIEKDTQNLCCGGDLQILDVRATALQQSLENDIYYLYERRVYFTIIYWG